MARVKKKVVDDETETVDDHGRERERVERERAADERIMDSLVGDDAGLGGEAAEVLAKVQLAFDEVNAVAEGGTREQKKKARVVLRELGRAAVQVMHGIRALSLVKRVGAGRGRDEGHGRFEE